MRMANISRTILPILLLPAALSLSGCRGVGIFAHIATTDKIEAGLLPSGLSASKVFQITNEYENTYSDYFSSGPAFYRRDTKDRSESKNKPWTTVSLPSGWTNIQSITASDDKLLLALAKETSSSMEVSLFYYNESGGFTPVTVNGSLLSSDEDTYKTILLYCPLPSSGVFYVNVLRFTGDFGQDSAFSGSDLYLLNGTSLNGNDKAGNSWEAKSPLANSYISGAAHGDGTYRFTVINPIDQTGLLTDEKGEQIQGSPTTPSGGLTWLPGDDGTQWPDGAFIMAGWKLEDDVYPLYISTDNSTGNNWASLTSSYRFISFLDVTETEAGGDSDAPYDAPNNLILAGTRSIGNNAAGYGYMEIVANDADPANWTIETDKNSFTFAQTSTYIASSLSSKSIVGLSKFDGYVYASTDSGGLWRIHADDEDTHQGTGLEWAQE